MKKKFIPGVGKKTLDELFAAHEPENFIPQKNIVNKKYTEEDIQKVLDGFTNDAPGEYIKTNFIELLNKQRI